MPGVTSLGTINTCVRQADAFKMILTPRDGVSLVGAVVTCQIKRDAQAETALLVPTTTTEMVTTNLEATFSWTEAQSSALEALGTVYTKTTDYRIEVNVALADAPAEELMRFVGVLKVAPGGIVGA